MTPLHHCLGLVYCSCQLRGVHREPHSTHRKAAEKCHVKTRPETVRVVVDGFPDTLRIAASEERLYACVSASPPTLGPAVPQRVRRQIGSGRDAANTALPDGRKDPRTHGATDGTRGAHHHTRRGYCPGLHEPEDDPARAENSPRRTHGEVNHRPNGRLHSASCVSRLAMAPVEIYENVLGCGDDGPVRSAFQRRDHAGGWAQKATRHMRNNGRYRGEYDASTHVEERPDEWDELFQAIDAGFQTAFHPGFQEIDHGGELGFLGSQSPHVKERTNDPWRQLLKNALDHCSQSLADSLEKCSQSLATYLWQ